MACWQEAKKPLGLVTTESAATQPLTGPAKVGSYTLCLLLPAVSTLRTPQEPWTAGHETGVAIGPKGLVVGGVICYGELQQRCKQAAAVAAHCAAMLAAVVCT